MKQNADAKDTYHQLMVSDETGSLFLYIYGLEGTLLDPSQIIQIQGGYNNLFPSFFFSLTFESEKKT